MAGAAHKTPSSGRFVFNRRKSSCPPQEGGLLAETERPTCAGAAHKTLSPGTPNPNTDHTGGQPAPLLRADESHAPKARRLVHRAHTAKSLSRLRRPTFRGEGAAHKTPSPGRDTSNTDHEDGQPIALWDLVKNKRRTRVHRPFHTEASHQASEASRLASASKGLAPLCRCNGGWNLMPCSPVL
jgi:hypothetical protein